MKNEEGQKRVRQGGEDSPILISSQSTGMSSYMYHAKFLKSTLKPTFIITFHYLYLPLQYRLRLTGTMKAMK